MMVAQVIHTEHKIKFLLTSILSGNGLFNAVLNTGRCEHKIIMSNVNLGVCQLKLVTTAAIVHYKYMVSREIALLS